MRVTPVESTTLATVGYDETREMLQLELRSHWIYLYFGVPAAVHQALLDAPSKGKYFNRGIRGRFPYRPITHCNMVPPGAEALARCGRSGGN